MSVGHLARGLALHYRLAALFTGKSDIQRWKKKREREREAGTEIDLPYSRYHSLSRHGTGSYHSKHVSHHAPLSTKLPVRCHLGNSQNSETCLKILEGILGNT